MRIQEGIRAACLAGLIVFGAPAFAQGARSPALPLPEYGTTQDVPGAANRPDPSLSYKVVFDVTNSSGTKEKNSQLVAVARYLNTLAQHGVPADRRNIAVVIHGPATSLIMNDGAFATRTGAASNPNTQLVRDLKAAGVDIHVCGQAARGMNITREMTMPEITTDLSGGISLINFQTRGYVKAGG
jgi:intracellular sulfur oxidation DsrE/DsrF family protein